MDAFDDLSDTDQPADPELERAVLRMLTRREADITEPGGLKLDPANPAMPISHRFGDSAPGGLMVSLLAAAAVLLVVAGSLFAAHGLRHRAGPAAQLPSPHPSSSVTKPSPTSTPSGQATSCPIPPSWIARISAGTITVDQPQNQPVSGASDGSFLMVQSASGQSSGQTDFTHQELAIFDGAGHGSTIWQAADPAHDYVDVSPDSAISANWVVFGLTRSQNLADHGVAAWNRATGQATTVRLLSAAEESANTVIDEAPIVAGDTAYWIEHKFRDMQHQNLVSQRLPSGIRSTLAVSTVARLVAVGDGVALLHDPTDSAPGHVGGVAQTLTGGPGLTLPAKVQGSIGAWLGFDGSTMRWTHAGSLYSWRPGRPAAQSRPLPATLLNPRPVGPFMISPDTMLDLRNGVLLRPAAGYEFVLATGGGDLIVTTGGGKEGAPGVSRVASSSLAPTPC